MHGIKVLARPFPKGHCEHPFRATNVLFGSTSNQHIFNSHLNYLNLKKTVWALNIEISKLSYIKCFVDSGTHVTSVRY